ncbi:hypothetical protein HHI36_011469 [Cryptolaemus montrouzieri]|uniref:HTH psq-type domain-containing protein n=1 Tax=Cryptolaemus montrouzieri TaxID=559131 RepID=A0ABD2MLV4_9CUCU
MGYLTTAKLFNVPRSTLFRFVTDKHSPIEWITNEVIGRRPVSGQEIENLLMEAARNLFEHTEKLSYCLIQLLLVQEEMPSNSVGDEFMDEPRQFVRDPITSPKPSTSLGPHLVQIIHNLSQKPDAAKKEQQLEEENVNGVKF